MKSIITTSAFVLALMAGSASGQQYKYSTMTFDGPPTPQELNEWSEKGFDLVSVLPLAVDIGNTRYIAYFREVVPLPMPAAPPPDTTATCVIEAPDGQKMIQWFPVRPEDDAFPSGWEILCKPD